MSRNTLGLQLVPALDPEDIVVMGVGRNVVEFDRLEAASFGLPDSTLRGLFHHWSQDVHQERWCTLVGYTDAKDLDAAVGGNYVDASNHLIANADAQRARLIQVPTGARVVSIDKSPRMLLRHVWDNSDIDRSLEYKSKINMNVSESVSTNWHSDHSVSESVTVALEIGSEAAGVKSKFESTTTYGFDWGTGGSEEKTVEGGGEVEVGAIVPAGEIWVAALVANQGVLVAELDVSTTLEGALLFSLVEHKHHKQWWTDGQHFPNIWLDVSSLPDIPLVRKEKVQFTYNFFADVRAKPFKVSSTDDSVIEREVLANV